MRPSPISVSVLTGFACIIYLFIICCFAHFHRRNDHVKARTGVGHPGGSNAIFYLQREKGAEVYVR